MDIELDSLVSDFVSEAMELLQKAETRIMELEESYDAEKIHSLFRAFHTIKGNSGMVGFSVIQELSHKAEEILDSVRSGEID
jgi:two-component system chemotaxis sensor kinase CheA